MRNVLRVTALFAVLLLVGCNKQIAQTQQEVIRNMESVKSDLKNEISASANNTNANMMGLVNASVSKVAEKVVGVEANLRSEITAMASVTADLKASIDQIKLNAQAGIANKLEQIESHVSNSAGRDVNYFPKEAVYVIMGILASMCLVTVIFTLVSGKNARMREKERVDQERDNVARWQAIALKAIGSMEPEKAEILSREIAPLMQGRA